MKERSDDVAVQNMADEANAKTIDILEACNFQDISGQRTTKVIKTINYLEERILSMIGIWGEDGFEGIEVEKHALEGDAALLHGPQHEEVAINQADIDALFD
jgi:chemotaxis protein CheZ